MSSLQPAPERALSVDVLDLERRRADAALELGRKAKMSDEQLLPLARGRLDAWRAWGLALGPAEIGRPENVSDANDPVSGAERFDQHRARDVAAVPLEAFEAHKAQTKPDKLTLAWLIKEGAARRTRARRAASRNAEPLPNGAELLPGDAREVLADVPDDSVELVLTDPPYGDDAAPLYEWLSEWSARVLVPGGSLVCFTGQARLDRDIALLTEHLRWWWLLAMPHHQSQRLPGKFVIAEFKPVLWLVKGHRRGRTLVTDVLRSPARDKSQHEWGQGEAGVPLLLEQLTEPGELVVDPFAGSARWGRIAAEAGRRWLGAEVVA